MVCCKLYLTPTFPSLCPCCPSTSRCSYLYALNAFNGKVLWKAYCGAGPEGVRSSATVSADGSLVYVGSSDGYLYSFNVADGSFNWKASCTSTEFATPYGVRSTPALSPTGEEIYVGSDDGYLYAFNTGQ